jgi:hypothetical protein
MMYPSRKAVVRVALLYNDQEKPLHNDVRFASGRMGKPLMVS